MEGQSVGMVKMEIETSGLHRACGRGFKTFGMSYVQLNISALLRYI